MQKTNSSPEARAELDKQEALKKRAAKQAAKRELVPTVHAQVECVVLPMGDGKISMGEHIAGLGTAHYEEGETFTVELPIAIANYEKGYVNFEGAKAAAAEAKLARRHEEASDRADRAAYEKLVAQAVG